MYILFAALSALFAGATAILAKCGVRKTDSDLATALRTGVVLLFAWLMVFVTGAQEGLSALSLRSVLFLALSGLATGASWLCYFKALSIGDVNKVVPVDKASIVLTVLFAVLFLGETARWALQLCCVLVIAAGTLLMVEKKRGPQAIAGGPWLVYALFSAVFAALTSILAKAGMGDVNSTLATALRTGVVLAMAWLIVLLRGKGSQLKTLDLSETLFIALSGIATGASWLFYYRAIQMGQVGVVVSIDKLSILFTVLFSRILLGERLSRRATLGLVLITAATLVMAVFV